MAKRFQRRICRVISATLQSCRSTDPSILPENPVPSFSTLKPNPQNHHRTSSFNHHVSSTAAPALPPNKQTPHSKDFKWQKEDKWHVVAKIYEQHPPRRKIYSSSEDDRLSHPMPPTPPPSAAEKKKRRGKKKKKNLPSRFRMSTSSADSGWFSSEGGCGGATGAGDEEETETLISSLSFSTDSNSSELNPHSQLQPIGESQNLPQRNRDKRRVSKRTKRGVLRPPPPTEAAVENPARLSMFKKMIPCTVDGKVKESFAIVKRSEDPYEDFKKSMMDMILEKQMFDSKDLEQLLQCFLSLNSRHYHGIIIEAFTEIWETIFSISAAGSELSVDRNLRRRRGISF